MTKKTEKERDELAWRMASSVKKLSKIVRLEFGDSNTGMQVLAAVIIDYTRASEWHVLQSVRTILDLWNQHDCDKYSKQKEKTSP